MSELKFEMQAEINKFIELISHKEEIPIMDRNKLYAGIERAIAGKDKSKLRRLSAEMSKSWANKLKRRH
jgi:hypothetical protein